MHVLKITAFLAVETPFLKKKKKNSLFTVTHKCVWKNNRESVTTGYFTDLLFLSDITLFPVII